MACPRIVTCAPRNSHDHRHAFPTALSAESSGGPKLLTTLAQPLAVLYMSTNLSSPPHPNFQPDRRTDQTAPTVMDSTDHSHEHNGSRPRTPTDGALYIRDLTQPQVVDNNLARERPGETQREKAVTDSQMCTVLQQLSSPQC